MMKIIIIGGGAAGFFSAINIADKHPEYEIILLEKTGKLLSKVKISGGGRCNVTNACFYPSQLVKNYPRGGKKLHKIFRKFGPGETISWFAQRKVALKTEEDNRIFPLSNNSQTVVDCFLSESKRLGIKIIKSHDVKSLIHNNPGWQILTKANKFYADKVIVATGNLPQMWKVLANLGLQIENPVPSLFTFNIQDVRIKDLAGIAFESVEVRLAGSKIQTQGPMLITHWGLSGPSILKLSAYAARELAAIDYKFQLVVNFLPEISQQEVRDYFSDYKENNPKQLISTNSHFQIPKRYWQQLCGYLAFDQRKWEEAGKKHTNHLVEQLCNAQFIVNSKSTFKDEFVTCGGVNLSEIDLNTMECKKYPGLYFAGEVLDIDAVTGGFNFQAAWSTAHLISENI